MRAKHCASPGCFRVTTEVHCERHANRRAQQNRHTVKREKTAARGYGAAWRRLRTVVLAEEPLCRHCRTRPATEVDHIRPHRGDETLMWDRANLQGLCKSCHSRKTATEDGGFGRTHTG